MAFEKLYTAEDVAQITGLTLRTIRNYIKSGRLKGHRVGVQWRFTEADTCISGEAPCPYGQGCGRGHHISPYFGVSLLYGSEVYREWCSC